jgi:DNA-binding GntR family transcriptional regulator
MATSRLGTIDRDSPLPRYHQAAALLEAAIRDGLYEIGDLLEGEHQLAERLGVSRLTLRKAVDGLVRKGLLVRERGVGTRVVRPRVTRSIVAPLTSLREDLDRGGVEVTTRVLHLEERPCPDVSAQILGIAKGDSALYLERLRAVDGQPIALMRNVFPVGLFETNSEELAARSLYEVMREQGVEPRSATQTISAELATEQDARLLELEVHLPVLVLERVGFNGNGARVEHSRTRYVSDRYSFEMHLVGR